MTPQRMVMCWGCSFSLCCWHTDHSKVAITRLAIRQEALVIRPMHGLHPCYPGHPWSGHGPVAQALAGQGQSSTSDHLSGLLTIGAIMWQLSISSYTNTAFWYICEPVLSFLPLTSCLLSSLMSQFPKSGTLPLAKGDSYFRKFLEFQKLRI